MNAPRQMVVVADDFGLTPKTSAAILDLAAAGRVTGTVLLVNSPFAAEGVRQWQQRDKPVELGWHACLTMDRPIADPAEIATLVDSSGQFFPLNTFLKRLKLRQIKTDHLRTELAAQCERFLELTGQTPALVNGHHHVHVFEPVGMVLRAILAGHRPRPYLRRNRESFRAIRRIPEGRAKRLFLAAHGVLAARRQQRDELAGADYLMGVVDFSAPAEPDFFTRWIAAWPGRASAELMVHPAYEDPSILARDAFADQAQIRRRQREADLLAAEEFPAACRTHGVAIVKPSAFARVPNA